MIKPYNLNAIKIGDTVYPAYDGKGSRVTPCKVVGITGDEITVKGYFWAEKEIETTATFINGVGWVKYSDEPTLMEMLGVTDDDKEGDFYRLIDPEYLREYYSEDYLKSIGLSN